ncbi:MAG: HlyD family efflux transporter periplasmic adaptor subunit, partial [Pseudomonadota bacterium]
GSSQAVENAESRYNRMVARSAQRTAVIHEIKETLHRSEKDLVDCNLLAPFSGRITQIHVSQGAVVDAGQSVVTLSLMDPIQVQVAVSADQDRRIQTGNRAILYPKDPINPDGELTQVNAIVYEKGAVAEPDTRTFRIDLIARNERRRIHQIAPETEGLPVVIDYLPIVRRYHGEAGKLFVHGNSIFHEGGKTYVLRLPGVSFHPGAKRSAVGKHVPEKVEVTLGNEYFTVIKWNFRSLDASGDLREGDFLIVGPKKEHLDGLAIGRAQWLLRPGDLVPVRFQLNATPKGLYVPMNAITVIDEKHVVFLVQEDRARLSEVTIHETYHELRRIEGEGIGEGSQVIISGVHYVSDGQPVNIVGLENLTP